VTDFCKRLRGYKIALLRSQGLLLADLIKIHPFRLKRLSAEDSAVKERKKILGQRV